VEEREGEEEAARGREERAAWAERDKGEARLREEEREVERVRDCEERESEEALR
jgi:hypothetical protein